MRISPDAILKQIAENALSDDTLDLDNINAVYDDTLLEKLADALLKKNHSNVLSSMIDLSIANFNAVLREQSAWEKL